MAVYFVEGNIGTGKSTFLSLVEKNFPQFQVIYEPVDVWTSLSDSSGSNILQYFYDDPKRYAYAFQSLAFISRMEKISEIDKTKRAIFIERSIWSDSNVFAKNCFMQGTLSDIEYKLYTRWFNWAEKLVKDKKSTHVYLKCSPEISFARTTFRKRKEESNIPLEYITQIHDRHEEWLGGSSNVGVSNVGVGNVGVGNVVTIDVSSEDYVKEEGAFKELFAKHFPLLV